MSTPANDRLLRVLNREPVDRVPVWMMRQAGRYLPEYRALRERFDFWTRVQTPELAAEITVQPVDRVGVDAAILFSDILVVPLGLGFTITLNEGEGPRVLDPVEGAERLRRLPAELDLQQLEYVPAAIRATLQRLEGRVPLIGFAGAPWTLFCYLVEGRGSKEFSKAKAMLFAQPERAQQLMDVLTNATIRYLQAQVDAGVHVLQLFDSWAGLLAPEDARQWLLPAYERIARAVQGVPLILFARGAHLPWETLSGLPVAGLGLDWTVDAAAARAAMPNTVLQGNLDPHVLLGPLQGIRERSFAMLDALGPHHSIANLGHGILPHVPVEHARAFVQAVKDWASVPNNPSGR